MVWSILMSMPGRPALSLTVLDLSVAAVCLTNGLSWPARALLWLDLATIAKAVLQVPCSRAGKKNKGRFSRTRRRSCMMRPRGKAQRIELGKRK